MKRRTTSSRKRDHVRLTVREDVAFRSKTNGFDRWEFVHNALPEIDLDEVDTGTEFLGRPLAMPLMVSCMTGGYREAERINRRLAEACEEHRIAMGVGSQRQALEDASFHATYTAARAGAPTVPLVGNIGAPELARMKDLSPVLRLAEMIRADGFAVHLNPLQEFLQPEGKTHFRGVLAAVERLVKELPVPVIVKEIGAGIAPDVALRLIDAGVSIIDVAGAGGTSWAGVEILRGGGSNAETAQNPFWDWGIPTADAVIGAAKLRDRLPRLTIIGSGGIAGPMDGAKAVALGADLFASARPLLTVLMERGPKALSQELSSWKRGLRGIMFLLGTPTVAALRGTRRIIQRPTVDP